MDLAGDLTLGLAVRRIRDIGGSALGSFSLGDIVSLAFHNLDNAGLAEVTQATAAGDRPKGGHHIPKEKGKGDSRLAESEETRNLAVAAIQRRWRSSRP